MTAALIRYRVLAYATGVFLVVLTVNIVLKYVLDTAHLGDWLAIIHGWLYLAYVIVTVDLWFRSRQQDVERLPFWRTTLVVLAGTVPMASFVAERWVSHRFVARPVPADGLADGLADRLDR
jgi:integral membrane protein